MKHETRKRIFYLFVRFHKILLWIPDKLYLKILYYIYLGKKLNLDKPSNFTEKMQWLKIYDRKDIYHNYVDKYLVRGVIKEKIGEEYLVPMIGVYDNINEIDWNELPKQFVLKATHTSGNVIVCKNKEELDIQQSKQKLEKWLKREYFSTFREWPYKNLKPRIICETFLSDDGEVPLDYKILCLNGEPEIIMLHKGRFEEHFIEYYDKDWNKLNIYSADYSYVSSVSEKPDNLDELLKIARILSEGLIQSRIDLYYVNKKVYFSEITFFSGAGFNRFYPDSFDKYIADKMILGD